MAVRAYRSGWRVDVTVKGRRAPRVILPTKEEAILVEARFRAELMEGRTPRLSAVRRRSASPGSISTLGDLFDHCVRRHWSGMRSKETQVGRAQAALEYFGAGTLLTDITTARIEDWAEFLAVSRGNKPSTVNRSLTALSTMLKIAVNELEALPRAPKIKKRKEYEGRIRYYDKGEETELFGFLRDSGEQDIHDMSVVSIDTGFRQDEIRRLTSKDYDRSTKLLTTWETKGNKARSVPCTKRVQEIIEKRLATGERRLFPDVSRKRFSSVFIAWRKARGMEDDTEACFHALRHTCCTRLVMGRVPLPTVQKWMGHKDIETTLRYAHLAPGAFDVAVNVLEEAE